MSEAAIDSLGNEVLAIEVKELYLLQGILNEPFTCAFCDIQLDAHAVKGANFVKAPHFNRGTREHDLRCPYSDSNEKSRAPRRESQSVFGNQVFLPERLIPPRASSPSPVGGPPTKPPRMGLDEALHRRQHLLTTDNHYTTSLLGTVVEGWRKLRDLCLKKADQNGLAQPEKWDFVRNEMSRYRLRLFQRDFTYHSAFHVLKSTWQGDAIHYGHANVVATRDGYELVGIDLVAKTAQVFPARIRLHVQQMARNRMTERLEEMLRASSTPQGMPVDWFAYGELHDEGGTQCLEVTESALVYLR